MNWSGATGQGSKEGRQDRDGQSGTGLLAGVPTTAGLFQLPGTTTVPERVQHFGWFVADGCRMRC